MVGLVRSDILDGFSLSKNLTCIANLLVVKNVSRKVS